MKSLLNPSRRIVVRAMALLFACAAAHTSAQPPRADDLKVAAAQLDRARAELNRARAGVQAAEERQKAAAAAIASRAAWLRWLESGRSCAEPRLLYEVQDELRMARYGDRLARAQVRAAKARRDALAISVREAEALLEIARLDSRQADDDTQAAAAVARARARVAAARHDRPGADLEIARAEVQLAEERQKSAVVTIDCRTRQVERLREMVDRGMVEQKIMDDEETRLAEAREARQLSGPAIEQARARLKAAEARLRAAG